MCGPVLGQTGGRIGDQSFRRERKLGPTVVGSAMAHALHADEQPSGCKSPTTVLSRRRSFVGFFLCLSLYDSAFKRTSLDSKPQGLTALSGAADARRPHRQQAKR